MTDVRLELDADHAATLSMVLGGVLLDWFGEREELAVLRGVKDVIDRQLAPETLP